MPKQPLKGHREHPKRAKDSPRTLPRPSSAARNEQTRPKRVPRRISRPSLVDLEAPKRPPETPKSPQQKPARAPKRFQNHLWIENLDFFKNVRIPTVKSTFSRVGASVWELKIDPKRHREEIKNDIGAPQAIVGSKKRANEAQESSKANLEALFGRSRGPKELPRYPQELLKGARESPKTLSKPS